MPQCLRLKFCDKLAGKKRSANRVSGVSGCKAFGMGRDQNPCDSWKAYYADLGTSSDYIFETDA